LLNLAATYCKDGSIKEVLGEFQFCFIMVLTLNNYSCLEQWKRILQLVLTSFDALREQGPFFVDFLETLLLQLQHCQDAEGGLFDLSDGGASLLKRTILNFRKGVKTHDAPQDVIRQLELLEDYLKKELGWQLDNSYLKHGIVELEDGEQVELDLQDDDEEDETGEYAPVVVETEDIARGQDFGSLAFRKPPAKHGHSEKGYKDEVSEDEGDLEDMDTRF
jgi:A1 cistron-splicing factor AAR2